MHIDIRPLREGDLPEADRIFRQAFGTFLGLPDPMTFAAGADYIRSRWRAGAHIAALGAFDSDRLVGSNYATRWGSFAFFGPLTIRPDYWDKGVAQNLLEPTMDQFARWDVPEAGLFTFPQSPKHLALYQKYDFWPQHLTALMAKPVGETQVPTPGFSGSRAELVAHAREVTEAVFPGLDVSGEIEAVLEQGLGEIVTVQDDHLSAFAVCHIGADTEAGPETAYIKFAAARPQADMAFESLMSACERVAARRGAKVLTAGVNAASSDVYRAMLARGFRTQFTGVAMQRANRVGYLRPNALVLGDWR